LRGGVSRIMPSPKLTTRRRFVASSVIDLSSLDIGNGSLRGQSYREAERPIRPYLTALAAIANLRVHVVRRRNARGETEESDVTPMEGVSGPGRLAPAP
jgi:hypothetical protein